MNQEADKVCYLYGFTQAALAAASGAAPSPDAAAGAAGLGLGIDEGHPPRFWRGQEVAAVWSLVSRLEFSGPASEGNLQDLAWLGPRVCRHQAVLEQVMRLGPVLPARFGTLFSSVGSLNRFLLRHAATIRRFLERVSGHDEWAVKGFLEQPRADAQLLAGLGPAEEALWARSPGLNYLRQQAGRIKAKEELAGRLAQACDRLFKQLGALAAEARSRPVFSGETIDAQPEMVLNWAFLVPRPAAGDFRRRLERANREQNPPGLVLELSGPWPPYSFCPALGAGAAPGRGEVEGERP